MTGQAKRDKRMSGRAKWDKKMTGQAKRDKRMMGQAKRERRMTGQAKRDKQMTGQAKRDKRITGQNKRINPSMMRMQGGAYDIQCHLPSQPLPFWRVGYFFRLMECKREREQLVSFLTASLKPAGDCLPGCLGLCGRWTIGIKAGFWSGTPQQRCFERVSVVHCPAHVIPTSAFCLKVSPHSCTNECLGCPQPQCQSSVIGRVRSGDPVAMSQARGFPAGVRDQGHAPSQSLPPPLPPK